MIMTDNPVKDAMRYDWEREEAMKNLPICEICDEHIQDDGCYKINNLYYHKECLDKECWRWL